MREIVEVPEEYLVNVYTVSFRKGKSEKEPKAVAWFFETSYILTNEFDEEEIITTPIIHSMN